MTQQKCNARWPKFWNSRTGRDVGVQWWKSRRKRGIKAGKGQTSNSNGLDGDHGKGCAFFNMCCLYFAIIGDLFPNDQARIHWALSFFKSAHAAHFANKVL